MSVAAQAQSGGREGNLGKRSRIAVRHALDRPGRQHSSGTYANNSPNYECRGITFPIVGWLDGDMISYTAKWKSGAADCK